MKRHQVVRALLLLAIVGFGFSQPGFAQGQQGVIIDAGGLLKFVMLDVKLERQRIAATIKQHRGQKLFATSKFRKVSLIRLESALKDLLEKGKKPTDDMLHLAGLTGVKYVFFYPETGDIVLAGPAEGWITTSVGRTVGLHSGRPTLELEDLIVALRTYAPSAGAAPVLSVSIDATQEGLAKLQQAIRSIHGQIARGQVGRRDTQYITKRLRTSLGRQKVVIRNIPPKSHFAQVLVEADYRMKLIGIGLERPAVKIPTYISRANAAAVAANALQRWYFVPNYKCVRVSEDQLAMGLVGETVNLVGEDQLVAGDGTKRASGRVDRASRAFTEAFTEKYPQIAAKTPVYAQMKNCIDLSIAAAFIRQQNFHTTANWKMETFGDESRYAVETHNAPVFVESAINAVRKGNRLVTPIGGGVNVQAHKALDGSNLLADTGKTVKAAHTRTQPPKLPAGQWWWD